MAYPNFSPVFGDSILKMNQWVSMPPAPDADPQAAPPPPDPVHILLQQLPNDRLALQYTRADMQPPAPVATAAQALVPVVPAPDGQLDIPQIHDPLLQRIAEQMGCTLAYSTGLPSGSLTALVPVMQLHIHYVPVCIEYLGDDNYQCHGCIGDRDVVCQFSASSDAQAFFIAIYFHRDARRPDFRIENLIPGMPELPTGPGDYDSRLDAVRAAFDAASAHHARARATIRDLLDEWNFDDQGAIGPFVGFHLARRMSIAGLDEAFIGSEIRAAIETLRARRPGPYPFLWLDYCQALLDHHTPRDAHARFLACEAIYKRHEGKKWEAHVAAAMRITKAHVRRIVLLADPDGNLKLKYGRWHEPDLPNDPEFLQLVTHQFANEWSIGDGPIILFIQYRLEQQYPGKWELTVPISQQISQAIAARELRQPGDYPHQWIHFYASLVRRHLTTDEADKALAPFADHYLRYKGAGQWTTMAVALRNTYLRNRRPPSGPPPVEDAVPQPRPSGRKPGSGRPRKRPAATNEALVLPAPPASRQRRTDDPPSD